MNFAAVPLSTGLIAAVWLLLELWLFAHLNQMNISGKCKVF